MLLIGIDLHRYVKYYVRKMRRYDARGGWTQVKEIL